VGYVSGYSNEKKSNVTNAIPSKGVNALALKV